MSDSEYQWKREHMQCRTVLDSASPTDNKEVFKHLLLKTELENPPTDGEGSGFLPTDFAAT